MKIVDQAIVTSLPGRGQAPDGITVLGAQYPSVVSLFAPLRDRVDLSLVHVNDWHNAWRGRNRIDSFAPPAEVDWQEWRFPPGWANRFAPWFMPMVAKRIQQTWRQRGWRHPRLVVTFPYFLPAARDIGLEFTLYRALDNYQAYWPQRAATVARQEEELIRGTEATAVTSSSLAEWFKERVPGCSEKIHYIPNGISPLMVRSAEAALQGPAPLQGLVAERFGGRTGLIVGHYSTISPRYGAELLLAAAERLPEFRFVLMGQTVPGPPDYMQTLARLAQMPNVLMTGHLKEPHSRDVLWQCDLMIIPIPMDDLGIYGCPNRLWTFMATGRPIVSTPMPEVAKFGNLVYLGDGVEEIVAALRAAAQERDHARILARIEIAKKHVWPVLADKMWSVMLMGPTA